MPSRRRHLKEALLLWRAFDVGAGQCRRHVIMASRCGHLDVARLLLRLATGTRQCRQHRTFTMWLRQSPGDSHRQGQGSADGTDLLPCRSAQAPGGVCRITILYLVRLLCAAGIDRTRQCRWHSLGHVISCRRHGRKSASAVQNEAVLEGPEA